jgi:hypothetical protein
MEVSGHLHALVALSAGNCDADMNATSSPQVTVSILFPIEMCEGSVGSLLTRKYLLRLVGNCVQAWGLRVL